MRRQHSGVQAKRGLWEVHRDPYDVSRIWVRDHRAGGSWVQASWKHLNRAPVPFGDLAWNHVSHQLPGATETEIADAVADLLTRAHAGPEETDRPAKLAKAGRRDRRMAARTKATRPSTPAPRPEPAEQAAADAPDEPAEAEETLAEVIPLGLFDPREDPWRRT